MSRFKFVVAILSVCYVATSEAQQLPGFWNDIQQFKQKDSAAFPAPGQILFIGSSSFTRWQDVNDYFPGHQILNRGFGGSGLLDLIRYRYELIYSYAPRQIVVYCGENDLAGTKDLTVAGVVERWKTLYQYIRDKYPSVPLAYVSMKPSPSRNNLSSKFKEANALIKTFLASDKHATFIDVYSLMLNPDGSIMEDIFVEDRLHMNAKGYAIWKKAIGPHLK